MQSSTEAHVQWCAERSTSHTEQRLEEMRALLAERREHLPLWHAYGQQLYMAGQVKVSPQICYAAACELAPDACVLRCLHFMTPHPLHQAALDTGYTGYGI